ncbi:P22 phage major capsid protein family protein [Streptomyces sp. SP18ES09]|uniref:P22 phage major capsid protein family protein n=1 Tax=Streptomyces sp. SP18ES09 TaxID=3002532 RepID=UPI002E79E297|nr:P22 phage major capsid protein family protein [Streptomyces sp. SP18ES09]MEE1814216.1 P22 phage major capsid protein family protein [Streptomyces sp. SP18ES09]
MANTFLTAQVIAQQALANLYESTVAASLVHRDYEAEFGRKSGDAITIRKPAVFTANEYNRAAGITIQDAVEGNVNMTLNHFADVSFAVTSEQMTLNIVDFDAQLLTPAMEAIAQKIDRDVLALRSDIVQEVGNATPNAAGEDYNGYNGNYPYSDSRVLIQAGATLDRAKVPMTDRRVIVGPTTKAFWVAEKTWRQADHRGSTEGLLEASLGPRVSGFDPYMTQNIGQPAQSPATGQPTTEVDIAFHKTAFALAFRPLELPQGALDAAIMNYKGYALRIIRDYDMDKKQMVVSIDCLYGTKTLDANRAVLIKGPNAA